MERVTYVSLRACFALVPILGIGWVFAVPDYVGVALTFQQVVAVLLGLAAAAAFLKYPYFARPSAVDLICAAIVLFVWWWMAWNFEQWVVEMADRTPDKWVPGVFAIVLLMEALRKATGKIIWGLVWVLIAYLFFGDNLPGVLQAEVYKPTQAILYLYADNNGIPGLVLQVVTNLVLSFILFGKLLDISGGSAFFTDLAMGTMGHRRGGPAKAAVAASSAFGMISGSTVGNIMSTGIVTIPLMKKAGFQAKYAAAIEAVASNGGQIAPPVMGATAFIIAEFLEVPYQDVVVAAMVPAALYYLVLFLQVDGIALRFGIKGLPKESLPKPIPVLAAGWPYLLPVVVLLYFLFGLGYNPGLSAMYATFSLLILMIIRNRRLPNREEISSFFIGGGENLMPLLLIAAAAGVVIGVLNATGLAFQLSLVLTELGKSSGIFVMLLLTALICIILGMGMPTATVYIVLVTVVAPALVDMGLVPMAAHLFLFYFGLISMLTPPVAVASMVAAELAGSDMWRTGVVGMQLAVAAYLLPFLWAFNPALIFEGSWLAIVLVVTNCVVAGMLLSRMVVSYGLGGLAGAAAAFGNFAAAIVVGSATIWLGQEDPLTLIPSAIALAYLYAIRGRAVVTVQQKAAE